MTTIQSYESSGLATVSAVDAAEAYLRRETLSGAIEAGERIRESPLAASLGISRHTLRAAFSRLEAVGLLNYRENRGWSVPVFDRTEYEDILVLRQSLESTAYRIVIERSIAPGTRVQDALQRLLNVTEGVSWPDRLEVDCELHQELVNLAGSRRLSQAFADMLIELRLCRFQSAEWLEQRGLDHWKKLHIDLVDAITRGDAAILESPSTHYASNPWVPGQSVTGKENPDG